MVRIGLVGCGTIGSQLARELQRHYPTHARITALHDVDHHRARALQRQLHPAPPITSLPQLIRRSQLVIEAASADAAREVVFRAVYTECNARLATDALRLGQGSATFLNDDEARASTETNRAQIGRAWDLWKAQALRTPN